ncbi:MAG: hypothetical protein JWN78_612 [Bacteroidota bacterium]|nr:hypothetical protein [Bacteroidota bacterium]
MPASDLYKVIRGQIEHVVNSRNQRIIWLVIAQSFFFSGYAILITGNPNMPELKDRQHALLLIFPVSALFTVLFTFVDILFSMAHTNGLRKIYDKKKPAEDLEYPPILNGNKFETFSSTMIPLMFIVIWVYILLKFNLSFIYPG